MVNIIKKNIIKKLVNQIKVNIVQKKQREN